MPSLNAQVRALSEGVGIDVPDLRTMQNQARLQGKWLFHGHWAFVKPAKQLIWSLIKVLNN